MAIHAAMVYRMDLEIGRVLKQIREMNEFEDTLILFLSDNGASSEIMVRGDGHDPEAPPGSALPPTSVSDPVGRRLAIHHFGSIRHGYMKAVQQLH